MDKEKMSWGLILLGVGTVILLSNLGYIDFYWRSVINMWPVILIVVGVNLLVPRRGVGNAISILVTLAALAFLLYKGTMPPDTNWWGLGKKSRTDRVEARASGDSNARTALTEERFAFDYDEAVSKASLHIRGGAIEYEIDGTTEKLFEAETKSSVGTHTVDMVESGDSTARAVKINFVMESRDNNTVLVQHDNKAKIRLNQTPIWDIQLDFGAGVADFDLSDFKIGSLHVKGGASAVEIKLGEPLETSHVNVSGGVSSIEIEIPESAACRIVSKSGLSARKFRGFTEQPDGSYTTPDYERSEKKYDIHLVGGLSSFEVKRY